MKALITLSKTFETDLKTKKELGLLKKHLKELQKTDQYISIKVFTIKTNSGVLN